jgi:hypothetical protein
MNKSGRSNAAHGYRPRKHLRGLSERAGPRPMRKRVPESSTTPALSMAVAGSAPSRRAGDGANTPATEIRPRDGPSREVMTAANPPRPPEMLISKLCKSSGRARRRHPRRTLPGRQTTARRLTLHAPLHLATNVQVTSASPHRYLCQVMSPTIVFASENAAPRCNPPFFLADNLPIPCIGVIFVGPLNAPGVGEWGKAVQDSLDPYRNLIVDFAYPWPGACL